MAPPKVFISYRRDDSAGHAGRLFDRLAERCGADQVFRDVDTLSAGEDFHVALRQRIESCDVMLVLIGPGWLAAADAQGQSRLDAPDDPVHMEVAAALQRGLRVVPVLLQGAALPRDAQLPEALRPLLRRQAMDLRDASFDRDVQALLRHLAGPRRPRARRLWGAVLGAAALLALGSWFAWWQLQAPSPQRAREQLSRMGIAYDADTLVGRAGAGDVEAVGLLLRAGISPDARDGQGIGALHRAVAGGHLQVVQALLDRGADGADVLPRAAAQGRRDALALLLARQPDAAALGRALHAAACGPHTDIVRTLLDAGAEVDARGGRHDSTALIEAAAEANAAIVQLLLQRGADPGARSDFGDSPLLAVLRPRGSAEGPDMLQQRMAVLRALLDRGAPLEDRLQSMQTWQPTALLLAIGSQLPAAALLLIDRGADVNARTGFTGNEQPDMSALMWATHAGQIEVVSALLDKGAQIDAQNGSGYSALMIAAASGRIDVLELLLRRGANPQLRDREGLNAMQLSLQAGHESATRLLAPLTRP